MLDDVLQAGDDRGALFLGSLRAAANAAVIGRGQPAAAGGLVETHHRGQQNGVGDAVGDVVLAAQRIAEGVDGGGAGGGDGYAGIEAGQLHLVFGVHGLRVVTGPLDVVQDHIQRLQGIEVAEGVGLVGGPALNGVGQGVHAGGGGDLPGQVLDHHRVQNDVVGDHAGVDDAHFQLLFRHGHNGVGGGLGAGAGGGGDHQRLDALFGPARRVQQLLDAVFIRHQDAGQLGGVHDATAAYGQDEVGAGGLALVHQLLGLQVGGLCRQVVQNHRVHAAFADLGHGQFQEPCRLNALVGKYSKAPDLVFCQDFGDLFQGVLAAEHGVGHHQLILCKHGMLSSSCDGVWICAAS